MIIFISDINGCTIYEKYCHYFDGYNKWQQGEVERLQAEVARLNQYQQRLRASVQHQQQLGRALKQNQMKQNLKK